MKQMTLKEIQAVSLDILMDVHNFCENNGICYSLAYGTLIGAIRHHGFIPWDDDVDIVMPRSDYERFCKIYCSTQYHLIHGRDSYLAFARVCDTQKTLVENHVKWCSEESGIWIDIFPVDGVESNVSLFRKRVNKMTKLWNMQIFCRCALDPIMCQNGVFLKIKQLVRKIITLNRDCREMLKFPNKLIVNVLNILYL